MAVGVTHSMMLTDFPPILDYLFRVMDDRFGLFYNWAGLFKVLCTNSTVIRFPKSQAISFLVK